MSATLSIPAGGLETQRTLVRISSKNHLGPDAQVDDKALVFVPTDPLLTDPFLALVEDWMSSPGFDWHPHRGLETVTTVVDGLLEHGDNLGHVGRLEAGEVQWMTAGRGIIHRELAYRDERARVLQMWLNLPAALKMTTPGYQDLTNAAMSRVVRPGVSIDVHAGTVDGVTGTAHTHHPVQGIVATLDPGSSYKLTVPGDHRLFAHAMHGNVVAGGNELVEGQVGWSDPLSLARTTSLHLAVAQTSPVPVRVMVYSGRPLREQVALGGPFVMNTKAELNQAFTDFHSGHFGAVPHQARIDYDR